jgi:hypothetical protein
MYLENVNSHSVQNRLSSQTPPKNPSTQLFHGIRSFHYDQYFNEGLMHVQLFS